MNRDAIRAKVQELEALLNEPEDCFNMQPGDYIPADELTPETHQRIRDAAKAAGYDLADYLGTWNSPLQTAPNAKLVFTETHSLKWTAQIGKRRTVNEVLSAKSFELRTGDMIPVHQIPGAGTLGIIHRKVRKIIGQQPSAALGQWPPNSDATHLVFRGGNLLWTGRKHGICANEREIHVKDLLGDEE